MRKLSRESVRRALVSVPRRARGRHGLRGVVSLARTSLNEETPPWRGTGGGVRSRSWLKKVKIDQSWIVPVNMTFSELL